MNQYSMSTKIWLRFLIVFKTNLNEHPIYWKSFLRVLSFASFSQENEIVLVKQIWHSKVLKQYFMARNISFTLLTDFKSQFTGDSNSEIKLLESLKVNLLFPENYFVFLDETWHSEALNQDSMEQKIRIRLLTDFKTIW